MNTPKDIVIHDITIRNIQGKDLNIFRSDGDSASHVFESLSIRECIFQSGINGTVVFQDPGTIGDYYNITGTEHITIDIETPHVSNSRHTIYFCVNNVRSLGDESIDALGGPAQRAGAGWELEFMSCESYWLNYQEEQFGIDEEEDFIGLIADKDGEGLVNIIAKKHFSLGSMIGPMSEHVGRASTQEGLVDIEPTRNHIWLKKNQNMYPWGKDVHAPTTMQLMNNLAENAVTEEDNGYGVNYLFYADLEGWHFKSIRKMIKEGAATQFFGMMGGPREYFITDQDIDDADWGAGGNPRIQGFLSISDYDHLSLWKDGAYSSYYERIQPNYQDPYFDYLDFTTQHTYAGTAEMFYEDGTKKWGGKQIIDYSYHRDAELWGEPGEGGRVEKHLLLPKELKEYTLIHGAGDTLLEKPNEFKKSRRKYDETGLYGYFDAPYNYYNEKSYDFLGSATLGGKDGKQNDILWQTMFDQTHLDPTGKILKAIQKDIKAPTAKKNEEHVALLNLKEKFNVYRHSICCDKTDIKKFVFLAWIDEAKKIQDNPRGGIYEYSWKEIEMWPKEHIEKVAEGATDVSGLDSEAPLKIVIPEDGKGMKGTIREEDDTEWSNPAYNLNELMNTVEGDNVYVGPGVNASDDEHNDYPEAYQMMPVGGYFPVVDGMLVDPCELDEDGDGPLIHRGQIVQMYRIPNYILGALDEDGKVIRGAIVPEEEDMYSLEGGGKDPTIPKDIYFFDVPNAHDGLCGCLS